MKLLRFIFPFLFVRNWYDGSWRFSRTRLVIFIAFVVLFALALFIIYLLQSPVTYMSES